MSNPSIPIATPSHQIGYCTNVHAGRDLASVIQNIHRYCHPIRERVHPDTELGIGLWFSEDSARQALESDHLAPLRDLLQACKLIPFTLNGFPQGDFHSQIVKHRVYEPTWWTTQRRDYTLSLVELLDQILPPGLVGSISTLPISWGEPRPTHEQLTTAASHIVEIAQSLHQRFEKTGRMITVAIEPEPGCYLTDSASFRAFYSQYLSAPFLSESDADTVRKYISLCHDVCHAAVMFEDQTIELTKLAHEAISIGKTQVSSAIEVDWDKLSLSDKSLALEQLSSFAEDRYLHQTVCKSAQSHSSQPLTTLIEDLPRALSTVADPSQLSGCWRVHFHVPIYLDQIGYLRSTRSEIERFVDFMRSPHANKPKFTGHFEIETYAWEVAPKAIRVGDLVEGIAHEHDRTLAI